MRYPASEKLEIIRLVERSHLPVRRTLEKLGIPRTTFYRWYDRYQGLGEAGLEDRSPHPGWAGPRSPTTSGSGWCGSRSMSPTCRHESWPCASPTRKGITFQRHPCTAFSRRRT